MEIKEYARTNTMKEARKELVSANILEVIVKTTGYCGGDTGHGGRTIVKIEDGSSTHLCNDEGEHVTNVSFGVCGDTELTTLAQGLMWAGAKLLLLADDPRRVIESVQDILDILPLKGDNNGV